LTGVSHQLLESSRLQRFGAVLVTFVLISAALRRPIAEAVALGPQELAVRFEIVAASDLLYVLAMLPGLVLITSAWRALCRPVRRSVTLLLTLAGIALLSATWSSDPATSVHVIGMAGLATAAVLGLITTYRLDRLLTVLTGTCAVWLVGSLWALRFPEAWSRRQHTADRLGGDWVGLFHFGNSMGEFAGITAVLAIAAVLTALRRRRWLQVVVFGSLAQAALLTVVQSGHTTGSIGLVCAGLATGAVTLFARSRRQWNKRPPTDMTIGLALPAATLAGIGLIVLLRDRISQLLGKPPGLHRTRFWGEALTGARARPLIGWGWEGYMSDPAYGELFENWSRVDPHNLFLQVLLSAGVVAFALVIAWTLHGLYLCGLAVARGASTIMFVALPIFIIVCFSATTIGVLNVYLIALLALVFVLAGQEAHKLERPPSQEVELSPPVPADSCGDLGYVDGHRDH